MEQTITLSQQQGTQDMEVVSASSPQTLAVDDSAHVQNVGVSQADSTQTLSVAQEDSSSTIPIVNGSKFLKGEPGEPGVSPTIDAEAVSGGHNLVITDAEGVEVIFVADGVTEEIPISFIEAL